MRMRKFAGVGIWIVLLVVAIGIQPNGYAYAYLDPGSGSFIIQILIASIAGAVLTLRVFWGRIIGLFGKSDTSGSEMSDDSASEGHPEN